MIKFSLISESICRLTALSNISDKLEKTSNGTLISFEQDKMTVHIYGNSSILEYMLPITNLQIDDSSVNYFTIDLAKFKQSLEKCNIGGAGAVVTALINENKVQIESNSDKTRISLSCYDTLDVKQASDIMNDWTMRMNSPEFSKDTVDLIVNDKVLAFADTAAKFMAISDDTNAISIINDKLRYIDRLCIIERSIDTKLTNNIELYIHKYIFDFIKPIMHDTKKDVVITYSSSKSFIKIDDANAGIRAVISVPEVSFTYPSDDEYKNIIPDTNNNISVDINKSAMKTAIAKFEGIFNSSEYKWKQINVTTDKNLDNKVLVLSYSDYSAEVNTSITVDNIVQNLSNKNPFTFQIPALVLSGILEIMSEDTFTMVYSDDLPDKPHGFGIKLVTPTLNAVCTKLTTD